jgi:riboflavin synthase
MFTGIVEEFAPLVENRLAKDGIARELVIQSSLAAALGNGESIAINGVCLTVTHITSDRFSVQVSPTTLQLTSIPEWSVGSLLNLERSVTPSTRLGGHWVLGHIDTTGMVSQIRPEGDSHHVLVDFPAAFQRWVLPQGSITIDGISLTVVDEIPGQLAVTLIPYTWQHSAVHQWRQGTRVNLEFDVLGKYAERLLAPYTSRPREVTS